MHSGKAAITFVERINQYKLKSPVSDGAVLYFKEWITGKYPGTGCYKVHSHNVNIQNQ